ncbi:MAG: NAD-dependent DNA ligase LigA [Bacteroidales bacterium]|nr:NAD-dependent DNA ligase LigA [Candidatus Liminaster caballi]
MAKYTIEDFRQRNTDDQQSLTRALSWASYKYYVENDPPMSDFEFDMEFKQLQRLEAESGVVMEGSPTQRVGSDIQGGFHKRRHIIPMQSIENVYTDEELQAWLSSTRAQLLAAFPGETVSYTFEPKYDGLSVSLIYEDGVLTDAVTRGNQVEGESVIENVRTIRNVPQRLVNASDDLFAPQLPHYFEVRGEVLMPQGAFERLNSEKLATGDKPFANKRNAASGSLKQLDPKVTARRGLIVNAYAAYSTDEDFQRDVMSSQEQTLALLDTLGFSHYEGSTAFSDIEELTSAIARFNEVRTSHSLPYDCDGVVVKVNERRHQEFLGLNTTFPNWCKARKFPQEAQSTTVRGVTFQVGMTGHITPVAELDPTTISGSVVSRATLNNENYIRQLGIAVGSYVFVQKAGEVIPQVTGLDLERMKAEGIEPGEPVCFPTHCPCCGTELQRKGEYWICPNHHCKEQAVQRLEYWCGKDCANIKGLGPSVLSDLYDKLGIASVNDLYRVFVTERDAFEPDIFCPDYMTSICQQLGEGYAEKSVRMMFDGIAQSVQTLTLDRIIGGLGIDGVGKITGRVLAEHFGSYQAMRAATVEDLVAIDTIGEIMARNIMEADYDDYSCLTDAGLPFNLTYQAAEKLSNALEGKTVIFTGTSFRFKREEIKTFFLGHGAKYVGSVSGKVDYVVTGDAPGQNKLDKARQLGVTVIAEREFYEMFNI